VILLRGYNAYSVRRFCTQITHSLYACTHVRMYADYPTPKKCGVTEIRCLEMMGQMTGYLLANGATLKIMGRCSKKSIEQLNRVTGSIRVSLGLGLVPSSALVL